ncbi:MAG: cupin domain-containing protein [Minisyncoccia bacterium]|jgi:dTDP-4-dehydrorhamnose 3,5-epimerase-like enzyme
MKKNIIKIKPCKKIVTFDPKTKKPNGWLLEVVSDTDHFTKHLRGQVYLTVVNPGEFKGYHLHAGADYFVTCLRGKVKEIIYKSMNEKQEVKMGDGDFKTVFLPKGYPHAIENISGEPAYVLIYRYPAWSPTLKEQLDISPKEIETEEAWRIIGKFKKEFK